jgi:hypothetical protein
MSKKSELKDYRRKAELILGLPVSAPKWELNTGTLMCPCSPRRTRAEGHDAAVQVFPEVVVKCQNTGERQRAHEQLLAIAIQDDLTASQALATLLDRREKKHPISLVIESGYAAPAEAAGEITTLARKDLRQCRAMSVDEMLKGMGRGEATFPLPPEQLEGEALDREIYWLRSRGTQMEFNDGDQVIDFSAYTARDFAARLDLLLAHQARLWKSMADTSDQFAAPLAQEGAALALAIATGQPTDTSEKVAAAGAAVGVCPASV